MCFLCLPLCQQWCPPGSPTIASFFIQMATDSVSWHCLPCVCRSAWICLEVNQGSLSTIRTILCCNFSLILLFRPRPGRLATVPWAVNLLMILRTVDTGTVRSLEMDLQPWDCPCFSRIFFSPCSVWHTTQRLSQLFSILTGCKCDYYIAHTCYLPQVCLNTNYRSITCLKSNYFLQFWQGANNFVQSIFEFCVKFCLTFLLFFFCCCSANKNNKYVNTNTFDIGTIFWEKCCIIWQNCKGANIFGHDCMYIYIYI